VTTWRVQVTGIKFIDDYPMDANGRNKSDTDPDRQHYPDIPEDFGGWGRGMPLTGWDWEGADNLERAACYHRQKPIRMWVRLRSSLPAPTARSFKLTVTPKVDGDASVLTPATVTVDWPAGAQEWPDPAASDSDRDAKAITTGGALPNEVSRYHVQLTWSVKDITPGGTIKVTNHKIFGIYEDPLDPDISSASGSPQSPVDGLTKKRLDKLTGVISPTNRRFPTPASSDLDRLIWILCKTTNDSGPPHFYGTRAEQVQYGGFGSSAPAVKMVDQWVMWLEGRQIPPVAGEPPKPWNVGACISYVQLMKTMLASAGINSRRAWVIPKTTLMPGGSTVSISASDVVITDNYDSSREQQRTFTYGGASYPAAVRLIDKPFPNGNTSWEYFEACLYYGGKLVPGAIVTSHYPPAILSGQVGFPDALAVLRWWHSVSHGPFQRFMAWVSESPVGYFDRDGTYYPSPYSIPVAKRLPLP
jgi:hypothetical protein